MSPVKNFDAALRDQRGEPIVFQLGGVQFSCPTPVPSLPILTLSSMSEEDSESLAGLGAVHDFLMGCIDESQIDEFRAVLTSERVGFELLMEIVTWLIEEGTARPTEKPSVSHAPSRMASKSLNRKSSSVQARAS